MEMVKVRNVNDHDREVCVGIRGDLPWAIVPAGEVIEVRSEVAYGWPADEESGLPGIGGLLDQPVNWALAEPVPEVPAEPVATEPAVETAPNAEV